MKLDECSATLIPLAEQSGRAIPGAESDIAPHALKQPPLDAVVEEAG